MKKTLLLLMFALINANVFSQVGFPREELTARCDSFTECVDYGDVIYARMGDNTICMFNFNALNVCFYTTIISAHNEPGNMLIRLVNITNPWNRFVSCSVRQITNNQTVYVMKE